MLSRLYEALLSAIPSWMEPARDADKPFVEPRRVGVYSVGVLAMAFFERLGADCIIGRKAGKTSSWIAAQGWIRINGEKRDVRARWREGLCSADESGMLSLPEIVLVCPNADQLGDFLEELFEYFALLDKSEDAGLEDIPKFLLASSGLYFEEFLREALRRVRDGALARKAFFRQAVRRRIFRAVAYQSGVRAGRGGDADYLTGKENARLILSRTGTERDRLRIQEILLRDRGYDVRLEERRLESEHDKALVNLLFSAFTQLYCVREGRLLDVRFGDLLGDSPVLPPAFAPQRLRDPAGEIRAKMRRVGGAFVRISRASGAYPGRADSDAKCAAAEAQVLRDVPGHIPSSFQLFAAKLSDPESPWSGQDLPCTEKFVLEPLLRKARELGEAAAEKTLLEFKEELLASYREAARLRDDKTAALEWLSAGAPLSSLEKGILDYWRARGSAPLERLAARLPLARALLEKRARSGARTFLVGIHGLPGVGKTTLAAELAEVLSFLGGEPAVRLSIDDFYHPQEELRRRKIAAWGPGAHDLGLAEKLRDLKGAGSGETVELPVFDKRTRDRDPLPRRVPAAAAFVLFEGFGVGLESRGYAAFSRHLDCLISLQADPLQCKQWRREAGWLDQGAAYHWDRQAFDAQFENLWDTVTEQAAWVNPEIERKADLIIPVARGHELLCP